MTAFGTGAIALGALRNLTEVIQRIRSSATIEDVQLHSTDLIDRVLEAKQHMAEMIDLLAAKEMEIRSLNEQVNGFTVFVENEGRYVKRRFSPGTTTYEVIDQPQEVGVPKEYFCAHCFENKKLHALHATGKDRGRNSVYFCPACETEYVF